MSQKSSLAKNRKYRFLLQELTKQYDRDTVSRISFLAETHYSDCVRLCQNATKGEWQHLRSTILPTVSVYKALLEISPGDAHASVYDAMMNMCKTAGVYMGAMLKLPGMKTVFFRFLPKMVNKLFGEACGFQRGKFTVGTHDFGMDMTACPYCRYAELFGCPELMDVFCDSDFATYGNLPGIHFSRSQTLGTGGICCDFRFVRE